MIRWLTEIPWVGYVGYGAVMVLWNAVAGAAFALAGRLPLVAAVIASAVFPIVAPGVIGVIALSRRRGPVDRRHVMTQRDRSAEMALAVLALGIAGVFVITTSFTWFVLSAEGVASASSLGDEWRTPMLITAGVVALAAGLISIRRPL